jgi:hypothetical protein
MVPCDPIVGRTQYTMAKKEFLKFMKASGIKQLLEIKGHSVTLKLDPESISRRFLVTLDSPTQPETEA